MVNEWIFTTLLILCKASCGGITNSHYPGTPQSIWLIPVVPVAGEGLSHIIAQQQRRRK